MNKYRVIEVCDHLGIKWYVPQRLDQGIWNDVSCGWSNLQSAKERIRRDITHKVVWECTEEEILSEIEENKKLFDIDD